MLVAWVTIVVSVVVGIFSGLGSSIVAVRAQRKLSDREAKRVAAGALRSYLLSLIDVLDRMHEHRFNGFDDMPSFKNVGNQSILAREAAYPYAHFLNAEAQAIMEYREPIFMQGELDEETARLEKNIAIVRGSIDEVFKPGS